MLYVRHLLQPNAYSYSLITPLIQIFDHNNKTLLNVFFVSAKIKQKGDRKRIRSGSAKRREKKVKSIE